MSDVFYSNPNDVVARGPVVLPDGRQVFILWDSRNQLFARLGWDGTVAWAEKWGYRLPASKAELREIHAAGPHVEPYPSGTWEYPYNQDGVRDANMRSRLWCEKHDAEVIRRCQAAGADLVYCNSKHYLASGGGFGGFREDGSGGYGAFGHGPDWTSYMLTALVLKDPDSPSEPADPTADTDPAPASGCP